MKKILFIIIFIPHLCFAQNIIIREIQKKYGYTDSQGNWIINPTYDFASDFKNNIAIVGQIKTEKTTSIIFLHATRNPDQGESRMQYGIIDINGNIIIPLKYNFIKDFIERDHFRKTETYTELYKKAISISKKRENKGLYKNRIALLYRTDSITIIQTKKEEEKIDSIKHSKDLLLASIQKEEQKRQRTFSFFEEQYITPKLNEWKIKNDIYLKTDSSALLQKQNSLKKEAIVAYIQQRASEINSTIKIKHISNKGLLFCTDSYFGDFQIHIPLDETPYFIQNQNKIKFIKSYFIDHDTLNMGQCLFVMPQGKIRVYQNEKYTKNKIGKTPNLIILSGFEIGMSKQEFDKKKAELIATNILKIYTQETQYTQKTYYTNILEIEIQGKHIYTNTDMSLYTNIFLAELKYEPFFKNNQLSSWTIPIWPLYNNNAGLKTYNYTIIQSYLTELYGTCFTIGNNHIWVQGDLIIKLNMKDESKPPYGSEKIPIITYEYIPSLIN